MKINEFTTIKLCRSILFLLFSIILLSPTVNAQDEFMQAHGSFIKLFQPNAVPLDFRYRFAPEREQDEKDTGDRDFDEHLFKLSYIQPITINQDMALPINLLYEARLLDLSDQSAILEDDSETLHRIEATPALTFFFDQDMMLIAKLRVGAFGNLSGGLDGDDIQVLGSGMLAYTINNNFMLVGGLAVTEDFDDAAVIPLVGLRYRADAWFFNLTLPQLATVTYTILPPLDLYAGLWLSGTQYRVDLGGGRDFDIQLRDQKVGTGINYWISDSVRLTLEGGVLLGKDAFEFKIQGEEFEGDLEDGGYFELGVGVRF